MIFGEQIDLLLIAGVLGALSVLLRNLKNRWLGKHRDRKRLKDERDMLLTHIHQQRERLEATVRDQHEPRKDEKL